MDGSITVSEGSPALYIHKYVIFMYPNRNTSYFMSYKQKRNELLSLKKFSALLPVCVFFHHVRWQRSSMAILVILRHPVLHDWFDDSILRFLQNHKIVVLVVAFAINSELPPLTSLQPRTYFCESPCSVEAPEETPPIPSNIMIFIQRIVNSNLKI